jgi:uncharacterized protein YqeY
MQEQIERDIKSALLSGDKVKVETLKTLKNSLQYEAVAKSVRPGELSDEQVQAVLSREAKKRQEAADLYKTAGETEREQKELAEKAVINTYLPEQMSEDEVRAIVELEVTKHDNPGLPQMGQIIGAVRSHVKGQADGALIARLVKETLGSE